nr:phosphatase PAP2 family protein [uncultured Sellimonas sp.]
MTFKTKLKHFFIRYKHAWVFSYILIYMPWFLYLEKHVTVDSNFHVIHTVIDEHIPFIEFFIVPYLLWFAFIAVTFIWFFFYDVSGFYKMAAYLFTGMTIFLIISTIFPNGLDLRPTHFQRDNIFVDMVKMLYKADTPTNVLPSIHVFNTIGVCIAISHSKKLWNNKIIRYGSLILGISIILATMFLKQHSIVDVAAAGCMAIILYPVVYARERKKESRFSKQPV